MRVMITTTVQPDTLATYYTKYLSKLRNVEVRPVYTFDLEDELIRSSIAYKIGAHFLPGLLARRVTGLLDNEIKIWKPDVLIIIKGQFIHPEFLEKVKQLGIYLVNYNPDHPLIFETRASGNSNIRKSVPCYDLLFTYSPVIRTELARIFPRQNTAVLPFGYEESVYTNNDISIQSIVNRICFAGTADRNRSAFIKGVAEGNSQIDVFGRGYDRYLDMRNTNFNLFPGVSGALYLEKLQGYRISLNLYRRQNIGSHNMRSFEIPAVGGIQVVEYSDQMNDLFKDKETIFFYRSKDEIIALIKDLMNKSDEQMLRMKENIRSQTLLAGHSYANRAQDMIDTINSKI